MIKKGCITAKTYLGAVPGASVWVWSNGRRRLLDDTGDWNDHSFGGKICALSLSNAGGSEIG